MKTTASTTYIKLLRHIKVSSLFKNSCPDLYPPPMYKKICQKQILRFFLKFYLSYTTFGSADHKTRDIFENTPLTLRIRYI